MTAYIDSYYAHTLKDGNERPPLRENIETDVCIIGGGLAGMATAMGLVERGKKVVVLEGRRIGWGASGRNGGFVLSGFAATEKEIIQRVGKDNARTLYSLTKDALKTIKKRISDYNIPCDPVDGHLVCSWYNDPEYMKGRVQTLRDNCDANVEFWHRDKVRDICRTDRYYDGFFYPDSFHMHPLNYLMGLAHAVENKGGRIFESTMALSLDETPSGLTVKTEKGAIKAHDVVFCGSAYFNGIEKKLSRACLPISTYVMVTEPIAPDVLRTAITKPYAIRDNRWSDDYYRILPDNRLLWGGRVGLGHKVPANLPDLMTGDLFKVYPQLRGHVKAERAWEGAMGYTVHKMPHIGQLRPHVWGCTNFGGNGLGPTTAGGEVIATAIADSNETYKLFKPFGFAWTGGVLGPLVAQAVYHSWELRDRWHEIQLKQPKWQ